MSILYRAKNVVRSFKAGTNTITALKDISLTIPEQSLTALCGRSGSGKTTLLNLLGTLDRPDCGQIFLRETEIGGMPERNRNALRRKKIGFIFQSVALLPMLSAYENVEFSLRVARVPLKQRKQRVEECLERVGLTKRMKHMPGELSGGEQQRVAIARAMAHRPEVLFADEPTAELDTDMGVYIVQLFRELIEKEAVTIIMTTHDTGLLGYADRIYTLQDGEIVNE